MSLVARGAHLDAIRDRGLVLVEGESGAQATLARARPTIPSELGPQDHVIVALKAHAISAAVDSMVPLLGPDTTVVAAQNGIPWWFFHGFGGELDGRRVESVDPGGRIWDVLTPQRAIGCVVYPSCEVVEPGVVHHLGGERLMLGEPDGSVTERVSAIAGALDAAGFRAPVRRRIRDDLWLKLWGNVSFNPVSALTLATLEEIGAHAPSLAVVRAMMEEAEAVARALGARFPVSVERGSSGRSAPASTRRRCSRTSSGAGASRPRRWSAPSRSWDGWSAWRRRRSTWCWDCSSLRARRPRGS